MQPAAVNSPPESAGTPAPEPAVSGEPSEKRADSETGTPGRILSVDALRGFDMFWLLGGEHIVHALCAGAGAGTFAWAVNQQFEHVEWAGFHFYDFIFPLFLFLIGVAIPFSVDKRRARGESRGAILRHALLRFCGMVLIGFFTTGNLHSWDVQKMGLSYSVLMMLGFGYLIA